MRTGLVALAVGVGAALSSATPGAAAAPYCGIRWGSLPEESTATSVGSLVGVRAGRHACFDRVVLDFAGKVDGYRAAYVPVFAEDGSGTVVPLRGAADLEISVDGPAYDPETGALTFVPADRGEVVRLPGARTLRQVAWGGSYEGTSLLGLGVRARLPFRVFVLDGPGTGSRVVVDVAHRW